MKKIKFSSKELHFEKIIEPPQPSTNFIPQWYKKISSKIDTNNPHSRLPNGMVNSTIKGCAPVFDSITAGYIITTPCDLEFVNPDEYGYRVIWNVSWQVVESHSELQLGDINIPQEYEKTPLKLNGIWNLRTPRGYSLLYTHPFYRYDLPFITTTGIVDSDVYDTSINLPFFIKKNFCGILPKGTPFAQVIPIKRENWKLQQEVSNLSNTQRLDNVNIKIKRSYKTRWWQRKKYS